MMRAAAVPQVGAPGARHILAVFIAGAATFGGWSARADVGQRTGVPHVRAGHLDHPPRIDGRLDDEVWAAVPVTAAFTQKFPREGQPPSEPTAVRIGYDEDAIYLAFSCVQRTAAVRNRLTRRDRQLESDWVAVSLDTRRDGKSAFDFRVNAAGVLIDSIRFNDTESSADWDENWQAEASLTSDGWSAEMRIPLRTLRFAAVPSQSWGLQVRRYVSERQETDEWAFIPRSSAGEVSAYGKLDGLEGLGAGSGIELSPFVVGRVRRRDVQQSQVAAGSDVSGAAGLDLKWHLSHDVTVDAAALPDFAQVEADRVILNLTNIELTFPERRRFFLEGIDTFTLPYLQLLYTRRIGRTVATPELPGEAKLVDLPEPVAIYGAAKLIGQINDRWEVGALSALTARNDVDVQMPDGARLARTVEPLSLYNVLRVKRAVGDHAHLGLMATSVRRFEKLTDIPVVTSDPMAQGPYALCPDGRRITPGEHCARNAHVAGLDWRWRSPSGDYTTYGQAIGSLIEGGTPQRQPDGTVVGPGDKGGALFLNAGKEGGTHWLGGLWTTLCARKFQLDDVGYNERSNRLSGGGELVFRTLEPWRKTLESSLRLEAWGVNSTEGVNLGRTLQVDGRVTFTNFWTLWTRVHYRPAYFDDREVGDGAALERAGLVGHELLITSDPRARITGHLGTVVQKLDGGLAASAEAGITLRALPELDLELAPDALIARGEPRWAATSDSGDYLFGRLHAKGLGAILRATYTFTPRLTLQSYAQLFLAYKHYDDFAVVAHAAAEPAPLIRLRDLQFGAPAPSMNVDAQEGALNVNLVLRWEYRPGAVFYLVFTRSQIPELSLQPGQNGTLDLKSLRRAPVLDALIAKLTYWWG
jgi:hypothetical protein